MIRKLVIAILSLGAAFLMLFAVMMWTSESIWSFGDVYDRGTKIRVSFGDGGGLIEFAGPLREWWPRGSYVAELAWIDFHLAYVGSSIAPPNLELKSAAVLTLDPDCALLITNMGFLVALYPLIAFVRGPLRRWRGENAERVSGEDESAGTPKGSGKRND
jgi:hypothetical protein